MNKDDSRIFVHSETELKSLEKSNSFSQIEIKAVIRRNSQRYYNP